MTEQELQELKSQTWYNMAYDHAKDDHPDWTDEQLNDFISNNKLLWHYMEKEFYGGDASNYKAQNNTRVSASSTTQSSAPNEEQQAARQRSEERVKNNPLYNEVIDMLKYMYPNFNDAALLDTAIEILDVASYEEEVENLRREYAAKKASDGVAKTEVAAVPQAETPAVSTTKAETPSVEAPKVETPKVQTTTTVTPSVKAPTVTSTVETPKAATPKVATPKVETATVEAPVDSAPTVSTPKVETPEVEPVVASTPKVETLSATPSVANTATAPAAAPAATPAVTQPTVTQSATPTTVAATKVETTKSNKNKFQQRIDEQAAAMEKAYADLRETYDDPTDEQILAVAGNNLRGYQKKIGNKAGNWGTAFGSNALWGTLNKDTRAALEAGYQQQKNKDKKNFVQSQNQVLHSWGDGDNKKSITKGTQLAIRNWGDGINEKEDLTPEQITALNTILTNNGLANVTIPTQQVVTKGENGEDITNDVQQSMSYNDMLDNLYYNMSDDEKEAFELLGFVERDGNGDFMYVRPHNETFDEKLARKEREQARIDLLTQQRALERQRARTGLADLAAGVGDMIKASKGAIVTPRDYQAMYDTLTAQQKVNYNNYLARMQAMKEAEKAKAKEAADRAYQERLLTEQRAYQEEQARKAQEFQAAENEKNRKHQESMLSDKLENQIAIQQMKNDAAIGRLFMNLQSKEAMQSAKYGDSIPYGGSIIPIAMNKSDALYQGIYGLIETTIRNHPAYVNELASIDEAYLETNPERVRVIVASALTNPSVVLPREINEKIQQYINDAKVLEENKDKKGETGTVSQVTGPADFITPASNDVASNIDSAVNISILGNNIMNQLQSQ